MHEAASLLDIGVSSLSHLNQRASLQIPRAGAAKPAGWCEMTLLKRGFELEEAQLAVERSEGSVPEPSV